MAEQVTINVDYLRTTRVHICMPCYGGMLTESTFMSFVKWGNICRQLGLDWTMETMTNESLISRARNTLVAKFLNNADSTHLMFIDADIGWEPWHLLVMLNRDVDVIGGLYPMKSLPIKWVVNGFEGAETGPDGLQEVSKTGTGFMLVKRHVFEKLNDHPAVKPFNNDIGLSKDLDKHLRTYYDTAVRENRYYSEDWTFCENWRDLGGKVWVDKRVLLKHTGSYVFDFAAQEPLYRALHQTIEKNAPIPTNGVADGELPKLEPQTLATNRVADKKPAAAKPVKAVKKPAAAVKTAKPRTPAKAPIKTPAKAPAKSPAKMVAAKKSTATKRS